MDSQTAKRTLSLQKSVQCPPFPPSLITAWDNKNGPIQPLRRHFVVHFLSTRTHGEDIHELVKAEPREAATAAEPARAVRRKLRRV